MTEPNIDLNLYIGKQVYGTQFDPKRQVAGTITAVDGDQLVFNGTDVDTGRSVEVRVSPLWRDVPVGESPLLDHADGDFHVGGWMVPVHPEDMRNWS